MCIPRSLASSSMDLEDKILGVKPHYYCSSDEEEEAGPVVQPPPANEGAAAAQHQGSVIRSTENTGPKGVINDWREFKKLQAEANRDKEAEEQRLMKRLCLTGATKAEDAKRQADEALDAELLELMSDDVLLEFQRQRVQEITSKLAKRNHFGALLELRSGDDFLEAVEGEQQSTVLVHIYEQNIAACRCMNECLANLAREMPTIKFCKILSTKAGTSISFKSNALPALIAYKAGQVVGNFVRITDEIGDEFFDGDVENFLIENGVIVERELQCPATANAVGNNITAKA